MYDRLTGGFARNLSTLVYFPFQSAFEFEQAYYTAITAVKKSNAITRAFDEKI
jgi:hypothetical protein